MERAIRYSVRRLFVSVNIHSIASAIDAAVVVCIVGSTYANNGIAYDVLYNLLLLILWGVVYGMSFHFHHLHIAVAKMNQLHAVEFFVYKVMLGLSQRVRFTVSC